MNAQRCSRDNDSPAAPPSRKSGRGGERAQHAVEDAAEQARPELGRERQPAARDGLSGGQPARVLVDLDGRAVALHGDDLARQASLADGDDLEHAGSVHGRRLDDRAVHPQDAAGHAHSASTSVPSSSSDALDERRQRGVDQPLPVARDHPAGTGRVALDRRARSQARPRIGLEAIEQRRVAGFAAQARALRRSPPRAGTRRPRGARAGCGPGPLVAATTERRCDVELGPPLRLGCARGRRARPLPRAPPPARIRHAPPPRPARSRHGSARRRAVRPGAARSVTSAASTTPFPAVVSSTASTRARRDPCRG